MKMTSWLARVFVAAAAALAPSVAYAHTGIGATSDFAHGFLHPLIGMDHILAMVAVGILAYQVAGRALWLVPTIFILGMACGGVVGIAGANIPFVELGIALSVIVLGAAVAVGVNAPLAVVMGVVGLFAIFHGHAHGTEIPENTSGLAYAIGFVGATGVLHLIGIGIGLVIGRIGESRKLALVRVAGGLMTIAGVGILAGVL